MSYLTTGCKNSMYGTRRTGVRLVLTDSTDPTRVDGYSTWYDGYGDALLSIGRLINDFRFERTSATGDEADPGFAAVYDIATPDPATAWPDTEASPDYPHDLFDDPRSALPSSVLRGSYALVGTRTRPGEHGPITGIHLVLSDGAVDTSRQHRSTACSTPARCTRPPGSVSSTVRRIRRSGSRSSRPTTRSPRTPSRGH